MVKSACGFEAIYVYFNGTGLWSGETISMHNGFGVFSSFLSSFQHFDGNQHLYIYI